MKDHTAAWGTVTTCLFAARQIRDILPALLGRHDTEDDSFGERIETVDKFELGIATQGDHLEYGLAFWSMMLGGVISPGTSPSAY